MRGSVATHLVPALRRLAAFAGEYRGPVALVVVFLLGVLVAGKNAEGQRIFLTAKIQTDILFEYAEYGILAAGMTLVILTAGIDLSVGSVLGLSAVAFALATLGYGLDSILACVIAITVGASCGLVSGLLISRLRFQPFVVTLAMMVVARGMAKQISGHMKVQPGMESWYVIQSIEDMPAIYDWMTLRLAQTGPPLILGIVPLLLIAAALVLRYTIKKKPGFSGIHLSQVAIVVAIGVGILVFAPHLQPATLLFLASILSMSLVVKYTRFGRHLHAIGGNEEAARLSGVPVARSKTLAYVLCGLLAGLAGISNACRLALGNPEAGAMFELDAIAAVVIGGTSLMGGRGSVMLTLIGALIMGYANKILSSVQIDGQYLQDGAKLLAKGFIIVLAVIVQETGRKRA